MCLKEKKNTSKNLPPPLKKFSAQGAKKVDYDILDCFGRENSLSHNQSYMVKRVEIAGAGNRYFILYSN